MQILALYLHEQQLNQNSGTFQSVKYCKRSSWRTLEDCIFLVNLQVGEVGDSDSFIFHFI